MFSVSCWTQLQRLATEVQRQQLRASVNKMKRLIPCVCIGAGLAVIFAVLVIQTMPGVDAAMPVRQEQSVDRTTTSVYLPIVWNEELLSWRMGFGTGSGRPPFSSYPELDSLKAGWYLNWSVRPSSPVTQGTEFVRMIRLHQKLTCPLGTTPDRTACPYLEPHDYTLTPTRYTITTTAIASPGSTWLLGNEMDRRDWIEGRQDEMLPELYAAAYHDLYYLIKGADPTAKIAVGGIVQATPLRLEYMTKVWDTYSALYGQPMPVDIWNVHAFILPEVANGSGADIPPGSDAVSGANLEGPATHINLEIFANQLVAFRQWMKERDQQDKPLLVSEYGVLYYNQHMGLPDDPQIIADFMVATFDYFLNTKDCDLGYPADECRLVQRWNWFSLDSHVYNPYGRLFDPYTSEITLAGQSFRTYSLNHLYELSRQAY